MAKLDLNLDKFGKEVKKDDGCELDKHEQRHSAYLIMTEEFPLKIVDFQILLTRDYLVINTQTDILYLYHKDVPPLKKDITKSPNVTLTRIKVDRLLNSDQIKKEGGFKIYSLEEEDFETVSQTKIRRNCI